MDSIIRHVIACLRSEIVELADAALNGLISISEAVLDCYGFQKFFSDDEFLRSLLSCLDREGLVQGGLDVLERLTRVWTYDVRSRLVSLDLCGVFSQLLGVSGSYFVSIVQIITNVIFNEGDGFPNDEDIMGNVDAVFPFCQGVFEVAHDGMLLQQKQSIGLLFCVLALAGTAAVKERLIQKVEFVRVLCDFVPLSNETALNVLFGLCELIEWEQRLEEPACGLAELIISEGLIDMDVLQERFAEIHMDDWPYSATLEKFNWLLVGDETSDTVGYVAFDE
jgi:hypothetical protein